MGDLSIGWVALFTVLLNSVYQEVRLSRQRRWDVRDREEKRAIDVADRKELAAHVAEKADALAVTVASTAEALATTVTTEARAVAEHASTERTRIATLTKETSDKADTLLTKVDEVHTATDGNLTALREDVRRLQQNLTDANTHIAAMQDLVKTLAEGPVRGVDVLDKKLDVMLQKFDDVGQLQSVRSLIADTHSVVTRELERNETDQTTRDAIEDIRAVTKDTHDQVKRKP